MPGWTIASCCVLALIKVGYVYWLHNRPWAYVYDNAFFLAALGVILVTAATGVRLALLPVPALPPVDMARWAFEIVIWHLGVGGAPVLLWQLLRRDKAQRDALREANAALRERP